MKKVVKKCWFLFARCPIFELPRQPGLLFCSPGCVCGPHKRIACEQKEQNRAEQAKRAEQSRTQKGQSSLTVEATHGRGLVCVLQVGRGGRSKRHGTPWFLALGHPNGGCKRAEHSRTKQNTAEPSRTQQDLAEPSRTQQNPAEPSRTQQAQAEPSRA